jgi:hypothetical protein
MLDFFKNWRIIPALRTSKASSHLQHREGRRILMDTDDLKKEAVESLLEQRNYVETETEENFFERTRNMDRNTYRSEFGKLVAGHINSAPEITFKVKTRAKAAGSEA